MRRSWAHTPCATMPKSATDQLPDRVISSPSRQREVGVGSQGMIMGRAVQGSAYSMALLTCWFVAISGHAENSNSKPPLVTQAQTDSAPPGHQTAQAVVEATVDPEPINLPIVEGSDIRFVRLKRSQGLSSQRVTSMAEDSHGFLWFGTDYGVNRYDGYRFRVFTGELSNAGGRLYVVNSSLFID